MKRDKVATPRPGGYGCIGRVFIADDLRYGGGAKSAAAEL
jgi:hypothetical protein